jgi:TonB-dependent receptor
MRPALHGFGEIGDWRCRRGDARRIGEDELTNIDRISQLKAGASLTAIIAASFIGAGAAAAQTAPDTPPAVVVTQDTVGGTQGGLSQPPSADEEGIVVTGFRGALQTSLRAKRNSDLQIDEINAEDIADFPDSNLAESLQRLPGVSIDRDNGEGRSITVRGLGGDFNRTRLNGLEALSTAGANDAGTSPNRSRSFDYNTFASELFSSLRVQKSSSAETDEGSLGATIDLTTGRPFDSANNRFALSTEGSYYENSQRLNPRIAGLASLRFMDGRMGILVSGAYSRSVNEIDQYRRAPGAADYLYRGTQWAGNENPQRAGFSAPVGTTFGTAITNPEAIAIQTGSDPAAYANLFPGAPFNTPGRFDDSLVRIPALASIEQQNVRNNRLGITGSYQWQISDRTLLTIDGVYSRFRNKSTYYQISSVGLNRNNTNATYNTAVGNTLTPAARRALYPGLCTSATGNPLVPEQDCGESLNGTTPAYATAFNQQGQLVPAVLGTNIFSVNRSNLDPYDYYNNPNSPGYIASTNGLAFRGALIGRPGVDVLQSNVTNGLADFLVLRNVDFRSAADQSAYTTEFRQGSVNLTHEFTDNFEVALLYGQSRSTNRTQGLLVEFNRMDSPGNFVYDERDGGSMPIIDFGFDAANPANWETVKGFSAIRHFQRFVRNTYESARADFDWRVDQHLSLAFGGTWREYGFFTQLAERNIDLLNPTLREAGANVADVGRVIEFGQGLNVPQGTASSFFAPDIEAFDNLYNFTCDCINQYGDWRLTTRRNGGRENFGVRERDLGFYGQADFDFQLFGRTLRGNAGLRVAITDLRSEGNTTAGRPIIGSNRYTDWLPSLNLNYEAADGLIIRFAAAKVMARPLLGNLSPTITAISVPNTGATTGATLTVGNPQLSPFRATNVDFSVEWYFNEGALLSFAAFNKDISSFPQTILFSAPLSTFADAEGIAAIRAQFTNAAQLAYIDGNFDFTARQFRDAPGGWLRGIEMGYQQDFTFLPGFLRNFGGILNYTYIKSRLNYILDPGSATTPQVTGQGPFLGVSPHSLNATLYYETDSFRARVSAAYRKGYSTTYPIASGACSPGLQGIPANPSLAGTECNGPLINDFVFSRSTLNIDATVSYNLTRYLQLTAEALNLTNQTSDRYAYQGQNAVTQYASSGRIYRFGARLRF